MCARALLICVTLALFAFTSSADARRHHYSRARERVSASPAAAMAMDFYTGRVLYSKNADEPRYPASITKVMTLYLLFDALRDGRLTMRTPLRVSEHAADQSPTKLGLPAGETITVADAIGAIVTRSANDMAVTVAEALAGSEGEFARAMTQKARTIGMLNTTFRNASGLPNSDQKTTAHDLIILAKSILSDHPERSKVFSTRYFQYHGETIRNHNTMLFSYAGMEGMKTGFTSAAGFNLLASAHRGDKRILAVVLGGASAGLRNAAMRTILDSSWGKATSQMAARQTGIEVASLKRQRPQEAPAKPPILAERRREEKIVRTVEEKQVRHDNAPHPATVAVAARIQSHPVLPLKRKPDGASIGILIASIENGLVRKPVATPGPLPVDQDMTTDEPEEKAEAEPMQSAADGALPTAPQIAQSQTFATSAQHSQVINVSIHYKRVRQPEVEPLDAVSIAPVEDSDALDPATKAQLAKGLKVPPASQSQPGVGKAQKLASAGVSHLIEHPGPYFVQVGSFADEGQATERLESVKQTLGTALIKSHPEFVVPVALPSGVTMYRARLAHFANEAQAKSACKKLRGRGIECWDMRAR